MGGWIPPVAQRLQGATARVVELERDAARQSEHAAELEQKRSQAEVAAVAAQVERAKSEERLDNLRLRARGLEQDQRERRRTVDDVRSELAQCQERYEQSERAILQAESATIGEWTTARVTGVRGYDLVAEAVA